MGKNLLYILMMCLGLTACVKYGPSSEIIVMPPSSRVKLVDRVDLRDFKKGPRKPKATKNQRLFIEDYRKKMSAVWEMIPDLPDGKAKRTIEASMNDIDDIMEKLALGWQP